MVAGERAWQLGRLLGVPEEKLHRGVYGFDGREFGAVLPRRPRDGRDWPRAFLFVGRYIPVKGIDELLDAYARYRSMPRAQSSNEPWTLTCCGKGPLAHLMSGQPGVRDIGFIAPPDLPNVLAQQGAFILPSLYEPWGVALAEGMATGMPAICTEACGASVDLVRPLYNGLLCTTGDARALAEAMSWIEEHQAQLPEMGRRAAELAAAFDAEFWATRCVEMFKEMSPDASEGNRTTRPWPSAP
jgi:glycosyltransferase involved in cell wall biosynthesis